jgi:hypothetical protein
VKLLLASLRAVLGAFSLVWVLDAQQTTSRSAKINEEMIFFFQVFSSWCLEKILGGE